jgi:hypothetical protein
MGCGGSKKNNDPYSELIEKYGNKKMTDLALSISKV